MKKSSSILTLVAAGWVTCAPAVLTPAAAADQRPADVTRVNPNDWPQRSDTNPGESPSRAPSGGNYHADYHADYSAHRADRPAPRPEEARDAQREWPARNWPASRDLGRPARPPLGWRR